MVIDMIKKVIIPTLLALLTGFLLGTFYLNNIIKKIYKWLGKQGIL